MNLAVLSIVLSCAKAFLYQKIFISKKEDLSWLFLQDALIRELRKKKKTNGAIASFVLRSDETIQIIYVAIALYRSTSVTGNF